MNLTFACDKKHKSTISGTAPTGSSLRWHACTAQVLAASLLTYEDRCEELPKWARLLQDWPWAPYKSPLLTLHFSFISHSFPFMTASFPHVPFMCPSFPLQLPSFPIQLRSLLFHLNQSQHQPKKGARFVPNPLDSESKPDSSVNRSGSLPKDLGDATC